jgi:hypothetical protein
MRRILMSISIIAALQGADSLTQFLFPPKAVWITKEGATPSNDAAVVEMLSAAPLRSELWLELSRVRPAGSGTDAALEMAFLTGGGKAEDIPARLKRAVQSDAFYNPSIQEFVQTDINNIALLVPRLQPMLRSLELDALPANRAGVQKLVSDAYAGSTLPK